MNFYSQSAIESTDFPPSLCLFKHDISSIKCSSCNYSVFFFPNLLPQDSSAVLAKLHHENEYGRKRRSEEKHNEEVAAIFFIRI